MIYKEPSERPGKVRVVFELPAGIWADRVNLCGDFNDWSQTDLPMFPGRQDGAWRVVLELDEGQTYEFRYLVNGVEWYNDWHADDYIKNIYGSDNSVVVATLDNS